VEKATDSRPSLDFKTWIRRYPGKLVSKLHLCFFPSSNRRYADFYGSRMHPVPHRRSSRIRDNAFDAVVAAAAARMMLLEMNVFNIRGVPTNIIVIS